MERTFISLSEASILIDGLEVLDDERILILGGASMVDGEGSGCGCRCSTGSGCGCGCSGGAGCGCGCAQSLGH